MSRPSAPLFAVALCAFLAQSAAAEQVPSYKTAPIDEAKPAATAKASADATASETEDEPTVDAKNQVSEGEFSLDDETAAEGEEDDDEDFAEDDEEDSFDDEVFEVDPTTARSGTPTDAELGSLADDFATASAKAGGVEGVVPGTGGEVLGAGSGASASATATTTTNDAVTGDDAGAKNVMDPETSLAAAPRTSFASTPNPEAHAAPNPKAEVVAAQRSGDEGTAPALTVTETPKAPKLAKAAVTAMQSALAEAGVTVDVDGIMGKDTRTALSAFQKKHGLAVTGQADVATLEKLGVRY